MIPTFSLVFLFLLSAPSTYGHRSKKIDKILEHVLQLSPITNIAPETQTQPCGYPPRVIYEDIHSAFETASNVLTQSSPEIAVELKTKWDKQYYILSNYWLGNPNGRFVLDFGCQKTFNTIQLVNTHNSGDRDRSTNEFSVRVSKVYPINTKPVLTDSLEDSTQQEDPLPLKQYTIPSTVGRFVEFEILSHHGVGGGLNFFNILNQSVPCSPNTTVVTGDQYPNDPDGGLNFSVTNLLTNAPLEIFGKNYWLAPDRQESAEFVLSLGCEKTVNMVELVNTHNGLARDRSMQELKVFLSRYSSDGPWEEVVHQTLKDSTQKTDPLPVQKFPFTERIAEFVKFNQLSYYGRGGGLQYFTLSWEE